MTNEPEPNTRPLPQPSELVEGLETWASVIREADQQWPGGLSGIIDEAAAQLAKLQADGDKLAVALERQTDSMAFVLNHMTVPDAWSAKFTEELIEDRQTLTEWKDRA